MILLDTNVLSALMRAAPDRQIIEWMDRQAPEAIWTTSINVLEVGFGLSAMADGRRRTEIGNAFEAMLRDDLQNRIASFDASAAVAAARLAADRQRAGRPIDVRDTEIAGIAVARRATIATRNVRHFHDLPTPVIDPWKGVD